MTKDELQSRFPDMTPVNSAPALFSLNGCGLVVYGKRDYDGETGTYVKTRYLALVFVPILALGAYRVADARDGGWYFIGKEPLSGLAKIWNLCVVGLVAGLIATAYISSYTNSPDYKAKQELAQANEHRASGKLEQAAKSYARLMSSATPSAGPAKKQLEALLNEDLDNAPIPVVTALTKLAAREQKVRALTPGLYDRVVGIAKRHQDKDPEKALKLCEALRPLASDPKAHSNLREMLLEKAVVANPQNVEAVSQLAAICEARDERDRCVELLEPVREKLGMTEGARILGQLYARQDRIEESYQLLMPYTEGRLKRLHTAEKAYEKAMNDIEKAAYKELNSGRAPQSFYRAYDKLDKEGQARKVEAYIAGKFKASGRAKGCLKDLQKEAEIVPVALDLGIVRLRRAQDMTDVDARKKELEGAEKVFLAVQGVAGESDVFRLYNAQIKYWLGKQKEGQELIDQFLISKKRDPKSLLLVCNLMREVGERTQARQLAEEAYKSFKDRKGKDEAAHLRAILWTDLDDQILWLDRCKSASPDVQASRASARARKALRDNNKDVAAKELTKAMKTYLAMPKNSTTLNNAALAGQELYGVTGNPADFKKSCELLEEAHKLDPKDSILLSNLCDQLEQAVAVDVLADTLDWKRLDLTPKMSLLDVLYSDAAGLKMWCKKCAAHPSTKRVQQYREKLTVLAPKSSANFALLAGAYGFHENLQALQSLHERALKQKFDNQDILQSLRDVLKGKNDAQSRKNIVRQREKYEKIITDTKAPHDREWAVAVMMWAEVQLKAMDLRLPVDLPQVIKRLEKADKIHSCARSKRQLAVALLERAAANVGSNNKSLATLLRANRRLYSSSDLIGMAMEKDPTLCEAFKQDADYKHALDICKTRGLALPDSRAEWEWALFRVCDPDESNRVVHAVCDDKCACLLSDFFLHLYPVSPGVVTDQYWRLKMAGKSDQANQTMAALKQHGLPVPVEP